MNIGSKVRVTQPLGLDPETSEAVSVGTVGTIIEQAYLFDWLVEFPGVGAVCADTDELEEVD